MPTKKFTPKADDQLTAKLANLEEQLKRTLADYANLEKRIDRERQVYLTLNTVTLLSKFIEVLDDFYLANDHLNDPGLKLAIDKFSSTLKNLGVTEVKAEPGMDFDHQTMECISTDPGKENKILIVHKPGYFYQDHLIRPTQVTVGKSSPNTENKT